MAFRKFVPTKDAPSVSMKPLNFSIKIHNNSRFLDSGGSLAAEPDVDVELREVYFLIMHFLSSGPCQRTCGQFWNELLEHQLLPRRYHAWYSRTGVHSGDENDDGVSLPLTYSMLAERYSYVPKDHLVKLLKQLIISRSHHSRALSGGNAPNAADVPTLIGTGSFSLLSYDRDKVNNETRHPPTYMRWPHVKADHVRGLCLREIGGGFARHQRAPSIRASCYAIAKPSTMFQKMQNVKKIRGHRNAVYCATIDRSGRYVITGSDDRLVKIWSMETAYCLASCRGHEGDITDLAVSSNNAVVASSSNDYIIRVWRLPDGQPISVLRGHTGAVTAIAFSPRPGYVYQLLSSSDDGTCRIWDARNSQLSPRVYAPRPSEGIAGRNCGPSSSTGVQNHQIFCCAFNSSGTVFVTGSSDTLARVWSASKPNSDDSDQPNYEIDVLAGHENDVNYVQFSGCAIASRSMTADTVKEENVPKFRNSWFTHDNIVTCSRDGSAIIWTPRSRRSSAKACRWIRAYHLKVPPPPMPPQPVRGGPRQRILPTPRGVNMIIWSLDNRFVLAAIMDCRICVWNASDGSLVHSLTGHSESTYVLDVHPFNPRIAMSAGYDGKIIVWDIWEGKPIRTHDISRFKLVDGKFSPDGTSIIMSDDVGQLYIVNTGQGESQQDAKYDQFFLGDYRPLIQDTHGNVLDQETQLSTFRRNMQDLLCDSGMIPYPEPYQSEYQKRRLGAMGVEWNSSSLRLATGPDFTLDPEFQMLLPLADLDILTEPLPEFPDMMEWEPEIEIHSDDNDSEYNVPEEYLSGGDQGVVCSSSSVDSESSEDLDGEAEDAQLDSIRRSKRKKKKSEIEVMTSSGRRVKRRNLNGTSDGSSIRKNRAKKSKSGRKGSRKKLSKSKLRPQRAAVLNALNLFSKITGTSTDGEEDDDDDNDSDDDDGSEAETLESGSDLGDSNIESDGSDKSSQNEQRKRLKGKETSFNESEGDLKGKAPEIPAYHSNRASLVLKFPSKYSVQDRDTPQLHELDDSAGPSSKIPQENGIFVNSPADDSVEELTLAESSNFENMKWGGIRARTTKRRRIGEATSVSTEADIDGGTFCDKVNGTVKSSSLKQHEVSDKTLKSNDKDNENPANIATESTYNGAFEEQETFERETKSLGGKSENEIALGTEQEPTLPKDSDGNTINKLDSNSRDFGSVKDSAEPDSYRKKMFVAVYRRTKSLKGASKLVGTTSNTSNGNSTVRVESCEGSVSGSPKTPSDELRTSTSISGPAADDVKLAQEPDQPSSSGYKLRNTPNSCRSRNQQPSNEEWSSSSSRATVGLRSTQNRRTNNFARETSPVEARRPNKPSRKGWLMSSTHEEGSRYIPQLGDEVAYLRQGHQEYREHNRGREPTPWTSLKGNVKDVEFCRVEKLDYSPLPGSGESCCKMTLVFVDPASSVHNQSFRVTLPGMTGFPDFLVERSRYDASIRRNWTHRDKCRVWWKNDNEEDGGWWNGRILAVKPKSAEFPESPWERYTVQYSSDPTETHLHSPWELFDIAAASQHPHIDHDSKAKIQSVFAKLEKSSKPPQDRYGIIKLRQLSQRTNYNNSFPVPVSLDLIDCRLENDYYRSLEAVKHDFKTVVSNALQHLGNKVDFSAKLKRLTKTFSAFV